MADPEIRDIPRKRTPETEATRAQSLYLHRLLLDDVIAYLANAPENRRARQVGEWERLRKRNLRVAA